MREHILSSKCWCKPTVESFRETASYHIHPARSGWSVSKDGASRALRRFPRLRAAMGFATKLCAKQRAVLILHDAAGLVTLRLDYSA